MNPQSNALVSQIVVHKENLRPFAINLTKNKEAAEDLIQDTVYRAILNADKFVAGTNIKAWLFTIMRNIFINSYRRRKIANFVSGNSSGSDIANYSQSVAFNGSESLFLAEDVCNAMKCISKDYIEPFMLHYKGFHYQEIADKMGLPLGTVKSRIHSARKALQESLAKVDVFHSTVE